MDRFKHLLSFGQDEIIESMKSLGGYFDLTPKDFQTLYAHVYDEAKKRLLHDIKTKDVMTSPVFSIKQDQLILEAVQLLSDNKISGVPVCDDGGKLVGVLSEHDVLKNISNCSIDSTMGILAKYLNKQVVECPVMLSNVVKDIMSTDIKYLKDEAPLVDVLSMFQAHKINRVPIIDNNCQPIGIISRNDILDLLARWAL